MIRKVLTFSIATLALSACVTPSPVEQRAAAFDQPPTQQYDATQSNISQQEQQFRQRLQHSAIGVERVGEQIRLTMPDTITFAVGKAVLKPEVQYSLQEMATVLTRYPQSRVDIAGHTDSTGSDAINNPLSQRRARAVANALIRHGVGKNRIRAVGYGSTQPILPNNTPEGRAVNRRVEILVTP